ncbi:MAG: CNNM domain-containing protein, partial [Lachnospiraceae bacterium]|nr:CNNM domain-containing protein [Lachnospiraceae bacterium]
MDSSDAIQIIILLILLFLSAFFSSAETCLTTISKIRVQSLVDSGNKRAKTVLKLKNNTQKMLSTILIGNNIVNLSASSLTTTYAIRISTKIGMPTRASLITGIATGILTLLILILGEIVPKSVATLTAEKMSLIYARPIYYLTVIFTPISFLLNILSRGVMRLLHVNPNKQPQITESELRTFVNASHRVGVIEREEREMITNVVDFGDSLAKDVMVPKADI